MQRVRMSLPYFKDFGWEAEVVVVDENYIDLVKDPFLLESIPKNIKIHTVKALSKRWTSKIGLGSIALRSLFFYKKKVNILLKKNRFDLIYFSTTQFPLLILGTYWKKKFGIPFVIDMQDPWHSEYYQDKPKAELPPKYWFSYPLNKYLEPIAMKQVDGLISVSSRYLEVLEDRYPRLKNIPKSIITFATFKADFEWVKNNSIEFNDQILKESDFIEVVYIGRGGYDMHKALNLLFCGFKMGLDKDPNQFEKIRFNFIGTSYAAAGTGIKSVLPLAKSLDIEKYVSEKTDRIPYYQNIYTLLEADLLLIIGSDDPAYTASKIYPYILAEKPILSFFHSASSAFKIIQNSNAGEPISIDTINDQKITDVYERIQHLISSRKDKALIDWEYLKQFSAETMTEKQCILFNQIVND